MTLTQLNDLCAELLDPGCERSAILAAMSDTELQVACVDVLRQYGLELAIGAEDKSTWMPEHGSSRWRLVVAANWGPIMDCQAAFQAVLLEMARRNVEPLK